MSQYNFLTNHKIATSCNWYPVDHKKMSNYLGLLNPTRRQLNAHVGASIRKTDRQHLYFVYRKHLKRSTTIRIRIRTGSGIGFHLWFCWNDQEKSGFKGLIRAIMWFSFLRPRDRFSLVELRFNNFSTDQGRSRNKFHFLMYLSLCCLVVILTKITNGVQES
ncbi:hypothetical protein YC2023_088601 [Brassica napus]